MIKLYRVPANYNWGIKLIEVDKIDGKGNYSVRSKWDATKFITKPLEPENKAKSFLFLKEEEAKLFMKKRLVEKIHEYEQEIKKLKKLVKKHETRAIFRNHKKGL